MKHKNTSLRDNTIILLKIEFPVTNTFDDVKFL